MIHHHIFTWFLLSVLLIYSPVVNAQDSSSLLLEKLNTAEKKEHYHIHLALSELESDSSLIRKHLELAITCAKEYNSPSIQLETYMEAAKTAFHKNDYTLAQNYCETTIDLGFNLKDHASVAKAFNYLGWIYARFQNHSDAINFFLKAVSHYEAIQEIEKTGDLFNSIGAAYWYQSNYMKAMEFFERALQIGIDHDNTALQIKAQGNMGVIFQNLAQYDKALEHHLKAMELVRHTQSAERIAPVLSNIGNTYLALKQYQEAINNYTKALELYISVNQAEGQSTCHNNLGECYLKMDNIPKALDYYQKALNYYKIKSDTFGISMVLLNMGNAHRLSDKSTQAIRLFEEALELSNHHSDLALKAEILLYLGSTLSTSGGENANMALSHLRNARKLAEQIGEKELLLKVYDLTAEFYHAQTNFLKAYQFRTLYANLNDSLLHSDLIQSIARMDAVYQTYKDQTTILNLQKENLSNSESLLREKSKRTLFFIVSISLLAIILILLLLIFSRRKIAAKLKEKNNELKQLNATKDKFFSIIAHDLKSPFNSLMGFSEMLSLHAETNNSEQIIEYSQVIHNSTKKLFSLVENLLHWSRTQLGTTKYTPELTDIYLQSQNIISLLRINAEEKDIVISSKMDKHLEAWADVNLFSTVLRNLLVNAVKFSRVGSIIQVTGKRENDQIIISVSDTGVGIRQEDLEKLFEIGTNISTKGTFNEKGTGLGLILCKEFVEINQGSIWAESTYGSGSTFHFTVPAYNENHSV